MSGFDKFEEKLPSKEQFYSSLTDNKTCDKNYEDAVKVWNALE